MNDYKEASFALITGASEGIGRAIAEEIALRKMNLVLVALPGPQLQQAACELQQRYGVKVVTYETDLTDDKAPEHLYEWIQKGGFKIKVLVNNAGLGHEGLFETSSLDFIDQMMQLNMRAVIHLTHLFLPQLKLCKEAYILNVGSMASFRPMPYKNIYTATKSFIFYFSRALREELRQSSIKVSVLCPGPVPTSMAVKKRMNSKGFIGKMMVITPEKVARIAVNKMIKGKPVIVPGFINRAILLLEKVVPRSRQMKIVIRMFKEEEC